MQIKWPSGPTMVTVLLLVLLPALAVLQYRWVGQVSTAEHDRMQRNLRNAAGQFRQVFEGEIVRAFSLQVGAATARDGGSDQYSNSYNAWLNTAAYPQLVADVFLVDADANRLRLRRWNPDSHLFEPTLWPEVLERWRGQFELEREAFAQERIPDRRGAFRGEESLIVLPLRNVGSRRDRLPPEGPVFGFTVLQLDLAYMRNQFIPQLAERHFLNSQGDAYRVAIIDGGDASRLLYSSEFAMPIDVGAADAAVPLFRATGFFFGFGRGGFRGLDGGGRGDDDPGRWQLLVQHEAGSLEAAVGAVRRRNLALSFGVLLMLTVSVVLLAATSRRAQRLAQQQMEFVAGVSHELRTPVAVIRSAAENLSQGVVGGERVKRYGQMLEGEARRLGEMVERVLQYAGIESGLGFGTRAPIAPLELIESAIDSAIPLVGTEDVHVQRDIAPELPPIVGDAAALRSAVQNLVANALKYGGRDRWVGVRAEHVRERRRAEVRITVSDHGPGIPAAELPHIFEPFYRGADALERQIHGNGLGLSLVRRIVAAHGGRVTVSTRPGQGSQFTIALPVATTEPQSSSVASEMQVGVQS